MSESKKILTSVYTQGLSIFIQGFAAILVIPMIIKMIGEDGYGAFEMVLSLVFINMFLEYGLGSTLIKHIPEFKDRHELRSFVWSYLYLKAFLVSLGICTVVIVAINVHHIFNISSQGTLQSVRYACYIFACGLVFQNASSFLVNISKGFVRFDHANIAQIIGTLGFIAYIFILYSFFKNYGSIEQISFVWFIFRPSLIILCSLVFLYTSNKIFILKPNKISFDKLKKSSNYLFGMSYITATAQIYNSFPKFILSVIATPQIVAAWGISEKLRQPLLQIQDAALRPLIPLFSGLKQLPLDFHDKLFRAIKFQYFVMSFFGTMGILYVDDFVYLWLGNKFELVSSIVRISFVPFILPNIGIFLMLYYSQGNTKANSYFVSINTYSSILLALILYKYLGVLGFISGITIIGAILAVLQLHFYAKHFNVNIKSLLFKSYIYPIVAVFAHGVLYSILISLYPYVSLIKMLLMVLCSSVLYSYIFYLSLSNGDKYFIKTMIKR